MARPIRCQCIEIPRVRLTNAMDLVDVLAAEMSWRHGGFSYSPVAFR